MPKKLSMKNLRSRLVYDYTLMRSIEGPMIKSEAYRTMSSLRARRHAITNINHAGEAEFYRIEYNVKALIGPGRYHNHFVCVIDSLAEGNYPASCPEAHFISKPLPWSPHVLDADGSICLGHSTWVPFETLFSYLVTHIAKLLNCDENLTPGYIGWNPEAAEYWEDVLKRKPITRNLPYPVPSSELTHGIPSHSNVQEPVFKALSHHDVFRKA